MLTQAFVLQNGMSYASYPADPGMLINHLLSIPLSFLPTPFPGAGDWLFFKNLKDIYLVFVCTCMCYGLCVGLRGWLMGATYLLLSCRSPRLNSGISCSGRPFCFEEPSLLFEISNIFPLYVRIFSVWLYLTYFP